MIHTTQLLAIQKSAETELCEGYHAPHVRRMLLAAHGIASHAWYCDSSTFLLAGRPAGELSTYRARAVGAAAGKLMRALLEAQAMRERTDAWHRRALGFRK